MGIVRLKPGRRRKSIPYRVLIVSSLIFFTQCGSVYPNSEPNLTDEIGQMLDVSIYLYGSSSAVEYLMPPISYLTAYHIGSINLHLLRNGPNLERVDDVVLLRALNEVQQRSPVPLLVSADIERGLIARVHGAPDMPSMMSLGSIGDAKLARTLGVITADEARAVGIQWALAPDADVNDNPRNPIIGDRSFGDDPRAVARMVAAYINGAHAGGMLVTAKHFPGQGESDSDSHIGIVDLNQSLDHFRKIELLPFDAAIKAGVDAIMLAHARVPAIDPDPDRIATTSPKIIGYLRHDLRFKGVIVTDALDMKGIEDLYKGNSHPEARAAVDAIKAGVDVVMIEGSVGPTYDAILSAVESGEIPRSRIEESVERIMAMKERAGLFRNHADTAEKLGIIFSRKRDFAFAQYVADSAVTLVKDDSFALPLNSSAAEVKRNQLIVILFTDSERSPLGQAFESELKRRRPDAQVFHLYYDFHGNPPTQDVLSELKSSDQIVVAVFTANVPGKKVEVAGGKIVDVRGMNGSNAQLFRQVLNIGGKKVMVISLGSPYLILQFPTIQNYACTYSISSTSEIASVKALFGEIRNHARLPVTLPGVADRGVGVMWPTS